MNNCLIVFGISFILMSIAKIIKKISGRIQPKDRLFVVNTWAEPLSEMIFVVGWVTFFITLVFTIYIYIFHYTQNLYFS